MSIDFDLTVAHLTAPGTGAETTAWPTNLLSDQAAPRRWRGRHRAHPIRTALADRFNPGAEHEGATPEWADLLRASLLTTASPAEVTAEIPPVRRPALALAAVPYQLVDVPHLGVLPIGPQQPAYIADAITGAAA
ncbi:hypothetical protein AB0A95_31010 [Micromonospora sp. NPDC049230]|uniref:hypothetical protein n=1 Tax=Micromonospora sp. NPDC049230 TaxID=3155502 RepID=UPI0033F18870